MPLCYYSVVADYSTFTLLIVFYDKAMFQAGKGLLRSFKADTEAVADIVPVDLPVNMMITTAWHTVLAKPKDVPVYHCTTGGINPYTWGELGKRDVHINGQILLFIDQQFYIGILMGVLQLSALFIE